MSRPHRLWFALLLALAFASAPVRAQESPYFVTYDHHLEEPGNLEMEYSLTTSPIGGTRADSAFIAPYLEAEYGVTGWWTTSLYLEGQGTVGDGAAFTGWRFENRFRPLKGEHWINPVLYVEYESVNEASRIIKEVEGGPPDFGAPLAELTSSHNHELEWKLLLGSQVKNWNISENLIFAKNFSQKEGIEMGYAVGVSRPLSTLASGTDCRFCAENFAAGVEAYGGLGSSIDGVGFRGNSHYVAPVLVWQVGENSRLKFSSGFGLNEQSYPVLLRFGYTYEVRNFGHKLAALFGGKR